MNIFLKFVTTEPVKTFLNEENEHRIKYYEYGSYDCPNNFFSIKPSKEIKRIIITTKIMRS